MPENPDLTPPPEEPMSEAARAEVRHRLAAAAAGDGAHRRSRRWVVPALAAAAVVAVVVGAYAVVAPGDGGSGRSGDSLQPAGTTTDVPDEPPPDEPTSDTPPPDYPSPDQTLPSEPPTAATVPPPADPNCEPDPDELGPCDDNQEQPGTCADELELLGLAGLQGATVTAERGYGPGTTYLYETKSAWIVCDDLAAIDGGPPTLLAPHDKAQPYEPNRSTLVISSNTMSNPHSSQGFDQFFAAGRDFDGVQAISYTFPDGHTEDAVVGQNGLWSMVYLPTDGVLVDPHQNQLDLDPITVEVDYTTGPNRTFDLSWALDTCGQINHGC